MRRVAWFSAAVLPVSCGLLLPGCEPVLRPACTMMLYAEGFRLEFVRPAWEPAEYRFEGEADVEPFSCTLDVAHVWTCELGRVTGASGYPEGLPLTECGG